MRQGIPPIRALFPILVLLAGCGGGGDSGSSPSASLSGTLAYVESGCREDETSIVFDSQRLRVRVADGEERTLSEIPGYGPIPGDGSCAAIGLSRYGLFFLSVGGFQRLAVSPNGELVVFEVTDDFNDRRSLPLPQESKGIFLVRSDGTGLRRLAAPSRERTYRLLAPEIAFALQLYPDMAISPSGRRAVYTDRGDGPNGETDQLFVLDLNSGERRQVTHLPRTLGFEDPGPPTCCARFQDEETLVFPTAASINGGPEGVRVATVRVDGTELKEITLPMLFANAEVSPQFAITGEQRSTALLVFGIGTEDPYREVFVAQGGNLLQLTNFRRFDTSDPMLSSDGSHVYFVGSADPVGKNRSANCQVFSIDAFGGGLRQVSDFSEGETSSNGCIFSAPDGCAAGFVGQDDNTGALVVHSNCDPLRQNEYGLQLFSLQPDSGEMRQLTHLPGLQIPDDSHVTVRLPGPYAFSSLRH